MNQLMMMTTSHLGSSFFLHAHQSKRKTIGKQQRTEGSRKAVVNGQYSHQHHVLLSIAAQRALSRDDRGPPPLADRPFGAEPHEDPREEEFPQEHVEAQLHEQHCEARRVVHRGKRSSRTRTYFLRCAFFSCAETVVQSSLAHHCAHYCTALHCSAVSGSRWHWQPANRGRTAQWYHI